MSTATYDAAQLIISFRGNIISGVAPGSFCTVKRSSAAFKKKVGSDGEVARSRSNDRTAEVSVKLMATSSSNDILSALAATDENLGDGHGPLLIKDNLGRTVIDSPDAWLQKPADVDFSDEVGEREWTFDAVDTSMNVGGTTTL